MLYSFLFDKMELRITIFINFQVYHRNKKKNENLYIVFSKLEAFVSTKLRQMTNFRVVFHMVVLFYEFDKIGNSTQSSAQPQSGQ